MPLEKVLWRQGLQYASCFISAVSAKEKGQRKCAKLVLANVSAILTGYCQHGSLSSLYPPELWCFQTSHFSNWHARMHRHGQVLWFTLLCKMELLWTEPSLPTKRWRPCYLFKVWFCISHESSALLLWKRDHSGTFYQIMNEPSQVSPSAKSRMISSLPFYKWCSCKTTSFWSVIFHLSSFYQYNPCSLGSPTCPSCLYSVALLV